MSGIAQGVPQRITAFVDPKTGIMTPAWYRFFYSLWERTGGAPATSTMEDIIETLKMSDVAPAPNPEPAAWLGTLLGDAAAPEADGYADPMADTPAATPPEDAALLAALMADTPTEPENDPALVAMMVAD